MVSPTMRLCSLNVTNLFTNIPVSVAIEKINDKLAKTEINIKTRETIIKLLTLTTEHFYFKFNYKFYEGKCLNMGSPLSSLLADIYINELENKIIQTTPSKKKIKLWLRYVDDILCIVESTEQTVKN